MKELSIEEKAKAYDKALERARLSRLQLLDIGEEATEIEYIFPELKEESEDEKTRKEIINYLKKNCRLEWAAWLEKQGEQSSLNINRECLKGIKRVQEYQDLSDWEKEFDKIASMYAHNKNQEGYNDSWYVKERAAEMLYYAKKELEKQGEKPKPSIRERYKRIANSEWFKKTHEGMSVSDDEKVDNVNKIEPKFKVGDFIVSDYCMGKVIALTDDAYLLDTEQGIPFSCEHNAHLWTIQDAKDGDVLCTYECNEPKIVFILKGTPKKHYALGYHCYYNIMYPHFGSNFEKGCLSPNDEDVKPATKEQRDLLFQKMKEAGYEWDAEKKELKKIEQKTVQETKPFEAEHGKYYYCIKDYFCGGKKQASKGDVVQALRGLPIMGLKDASEYFLPVNFIKCNSAWSEEDENVLEDIEEAIINYWHGDTQDILLDWLNSLKQRIKGE